MENRSLKTEDLRLARVKYFDIEHNGAELTDVEAYAFLQKVGDKYVNVFDLTEDMPVLDRSIYPNVMRNGEEFGNRLIHVCGHLTDGPCYVIEPVNVRALFGYDLIGSNELKEYVLRSESFFVDRLNLIKGEKSVRRLGMLSTVKSDEAKMAELKEYIASHEKAKQYVK